MIKQKEKKINTWATFKRLLKFAKPYQFWLILTIAASMVRAVSVIIFAKGIKGLVDSAISNNMDSLVSYFYLMLIAFVLEISTAVLRTYSSGRFAEYNVFDMRQKSEKHVCNLPISYLENHSTGDLISRLTNDLDIVKGFFENTLSNLISNSIVGTVAIVYLFTLNWKLTLLIGILAPVLTLMATKLSKPIQDYTKKSQEFAADAVSVTQDSIFGISEIKSFVLESEMIGKYNKSIDKSKFYAIKSYLFEVVRIYPIGISAHVLPFISTLFLGGLLIIQKEITYGMLLAFIGLSDEIVHPIANIPRLISSLRSSVAAVDRIFEVWDENPEREGGKSYTNNGDSVICFDHVIFSYDSKNVLFEDLCFNIKKGETVALVGSSGCGKSTVLKLVTDFYSPSAGNIFIFGHPITEWDLDEMRGFIAEVLQDSYLFPDTIFKNIAYGKPLAEKTQVDEAARAANIYDFIQGLPEQYDTLTGERGIKLSGGQRQRIAIARALLKDAPILLLDEATSALDTESEYEVQTALERLMKGRTTLVVAHRLSTIKNADRILVMNDGKIVECGTHDELLKNGSFYSKLYYNQFAVQQGETLEEAEGQAH